MAAPQLYSLFLLLAAAQGLVLGIAALRSKKGQLISNRLLAALLFLGAYQLGVEFLRNAGLAGVNHWSYHVLIEFHWIYGPLTYFYVKSWLQPGFRMTRAEWWWLFPGLLQVIFSNWVKIQNFYWAGSPEDLPFLGSESYVLWMHTPFQYLLLLGGIGYFSWKGKRLLVSAKNTEAARFEYSDLKWLKWILLAFQSFALLGMALTLVDFIWFDYAFEPFYPFPLFLGLAALTYWLALSGFVQRGDLLKPPQVPLETGKAESFSAILTGADQLMEKDRLFLDPELSLQGLAGRLGIKPYLLTRALNQLRGQSFRQYLNSYRIAEAQHLLRSSNHQHFSIAAIGFEAGFNSKATFNRTFKNESGMTPLEWKNSLD